jgi:hypothetical protein
MTNRLTARAAAWLGTTLLVAGTGSAQVLIGQGPETDFALPQASDDGVVVVMSRRGPDARRSHRPHAPEDGTVVVMSRREALGPCLTGCFRDVVVFDLSEPCGNDVHRELLSAADPEEWLQEPSVTADGATVAYWIQRPDGFHFERVSADGGRPEEIFHDTAAESVTSFDLSPTGDHAAYVRGIPGAHVRSIKGGMAELVLLDLRAGLPATVAYTDAAAWVDLNQQRPMADSGRIFYAKSDALGVNVYRYDPARSLLVGETASLDSHGPPSTNRLGTKMAWTLTSGASGVTNVLVKTIATGMAIPVTSSTSSSWTFHGPVISPDGQRVAFGSTGDHVTGENADGTWDLFRANSDGTALEQLTDLQPVPIETREFRGVSLASGGSVVVHALGDAVHGDVVKLDSLDLPLSPPIQPTTRGVLPPFDVVTSLPDEPSLRCVVDGFGVSTCSAWVRNSREGERTLLALVEWDVATRCPGLVRRQPIRLSLAAGERALLADGLGECPNASGVFRVTAVDTSAAQVDHSGSETAFP